MGKSKSIGDIIRERREAAGITQADLARRIKTNPQVINRMEQGNRPDPRWSTIVRIAAVLGSSLDAFAAEAGHRITLRESGKIDSDLTIIARDLEEVLRHLNTVRTRTHQA